MRTLTETEQERVGAVKMTRTKKGKGKSIKFVLRVLVTADGTRRVRGDEKGYGNPVFFPEGRAFDPFFMALCARALNLVQQQEATPDASDA